MSCAIASSSRTTLTSKMFSNQIRTVVHHARPPRMPRLSSPHNPKLPLPTSGTSHPYPNSPDGLGLKRASTELRDTSLTFHYAPPPSAPSYTTGSLPPLLKWVRGETVSRTGEEIAPLRKSPMARDREIEWDESLMERMRELRIGGASRNNIAKELSIPTSQVPLIARAAPLTKEQTEKRASVISAQKSSWPYKKRLTREMRVRRKTFW